MCVATQRERDCVALDLIRPGGRLLVVREWDEGGLSFGEYCIDLDCLGREYRLELARMGRECFETCRAQG